jgi:hypothetical protein
MAQRGQPQFRDRPRCCSQHCPFPPIPVRNIFLEQRVPLRLSSSFVLLFNEDNPLFFGILLRVSVNFGLLFVGELEPLRTIGVRRWRMVVKVVHELAKLQVMLKNEVLPQVHRGLPELPVEDPGYHFLVFPAIQGDLNTLFVMVMVEIGVHQVYLLKSKSQVHIQSFIAKLIIVSRGWLEEPGIPASEGLLDYDIKRLC